MKEDKGQEIFRIDSISYVNVQKKITCMWATMHVKQRVNHLAVWISILNVKIFQYRQISGVIWSTK